MCSTPKEAIKSSLSDTTTKLVLLSGLGMIKQIKREGYCTHTRYKHYTCVIIIYVIAHSLYYPAPLIVNQELRAEYEKSHKLGVEDEKVIYEKLRQRFEELTATESSHAEAKGGSEEGQSGKDDY